MTAKHDAFRRMAERLMDDHGLDSWEFRWSNAKKRLGCCSYPDQSLRFTRWLVDVPEAEQRDIVLHEVAHALAGPRAGHGPVWRAAARRIGARPQACTTSKAVRDAQPKGKWVGRCKVHGIVRRMFREPQVIRACGKCTRVWDPTKVLKFTHADHGGTPRNARYRTQYAHAIKEG